ncbi:hypothetical protein [Elizabethkingia anophelis]|uniref:hypothetical protein n=1 Tax=Elizabethkingia anophelis TaxID=1117645 RepID=UPI000442BFBE|nr:hypothetical protein [Elizabethkingia anophelis]CDN79544.1 conserved hypothetical protein [Elizabethkingia anophelis]
MPKHITVASSWEELNTWQLEEIVNLFHNYSNDNFSESYLKMILILFQKKKGFWSSLKLRWLLRNVPISTLSEFGKFLLDSPKLHSFPEIPGLKKPADRLGDLSIKQFSFMDQFFYNWMKTKSDTYLRALVASIYRLGDTFDEQNLPAISKFTDKLTKKQWQVIAMTYMSCYNHMCEQFPIIYPKPKNPDKGPKKDPKHTPFSEIIISIVMEDDKQPLGNLHESNATRIYEFMNIFSKIIVKREKLANEYAKGK